MEFRHFTTNDGLPSSETYFAFEDRAGYIWVGTDNGIARFNGYEFTVFDGDDGLDDSVVFMIQENADGRIWVSTLSGRVFYFEEDEFHPFTANDALLKLKESSELFFLLDVWETGEIIIRVNYEGIIKANPDGEITWLTDTIGTKYYIYRPRNVSSSHPRQSRYFIGGSQRRGRADEGPVLVWEDDQWVPYGDGSLTLEGLYDGRPAILDMTAENNGIMITGRYNLIHLLPDGSSKYSFPNKSRIATHLLHMRGNEYFMSANGGIGLVKLKLDYEESTIQADTFLRGRSLSMVTKDRKGGIWATSLDAGLFYCPYPDQQVFVAENGGLSPRPTALVLVDEHTVVGAYADGGIICFNDSTKTSQIVNFSGQNTGFQGDDILYDPTTRHLFWLDRFFTIDNDPVSFVNDWARYATAEGRYTDNIKEFALVDKQLYWTGTQNFGTLDPETGITQSKYLRYGQDVNFVHGLESYFPFPDGREFIGTWYGLRRIEQDGSLTPDDLGIPELQGRIERIVGWGKDRIAIGTRASGLIIWTPEKHFVVGKAQNLASDIVRNLHVTEGGTLWVATLEGLSKVEFQKGDEAPRVRTFNVGNGLLDDEVHDLDSRGEDLWIASTVGIYKFVEPAFDSLSTPPRINQVVVNGEPVTVQPTLSFKPYENYLSFAYSTIIFSVGDDLLYRYRINPDQVWQTSRERMANYPSLPAGDYRFEVQSQNQDGIWSESSVVQIAIAERWINTWQPWVLGIALLMGITIFTFRRRESNRRREEDLRTEISRLEHSALHAQMNPHFVFNSLNSIQYFILHNDVRQAATYLSRFAQLIRKTLRSSVRGQHSLQDEKEMLNGYLELEQLRFKGVFDYSISVDPNLPGAEIMLPPLLIQPFVENAIIHGFREISEGGLITINIKGTAELLYVTVTDNGVGIDPNKSPGEDSLGMQITRRRLDLVGKIKKKGLTLDIAPVILPNGSVGGTRASLQIRPLPPTPNDSPE